MSRHAATARLLTVTVLLSAILPVAGCGKKGYPLPPLRLVPEAVGSLHVKQVGDRVVLSLPRPSSRTDGSPLGPDAAVQLLMTVREPPPRRPAEVEADPTLRWALQAPRWDAYAQGERVEVSLGLARIAEHLGLPGGLTAGRHLSFVARVVEPKGLRSDPTDVVTLAICEPPPAPAGAFAWNSEQGLRLQWRGAEPAGASAPRPAYNVYRWVAGGPRPEAPLNGTPGAATSYLDESAVPDTTYRYVVRSVSVSASCESADTGEIPADRVDLFPPEPPGGLAAVSEGGAIRLFWRPGVEHDLRGYRVYRASGAGAPLLLLTPEPLTFTSYTDADVVPGIDYGYAVTALDGARPPNESPFSDLAAERMEAQE